MHPSPCGPALDSLPVANLGSARPSCASEIRCAIIRCGTSLSLSASCRIALVLPLPLAALGLGYASAHSPLTNRTQLRKSASPSSALQQAASRLIAYFPHCDSGSQIALAFFSNAIQEGKLPPPRKRFRCAIDCRGTTARG